MSDLDRMHRALVAADAAGDTESATAIARAIRAAQPAPQGPSFGERVGMGLGDPVQGGAQLLANSLPTGVVDAVNRGAAWLNERLPITARLGMTPATPQQVNAQVATREADYQGRREAAGQTGPDWARIGGNVVATAPLAIASPAATTMGRAITGGAMMGAGASALNPIPDATEENFGTQKGRQVVTGAAMGAATGPVAYGIGRLISPRLDPNVAKLQAEGVEMTPGQIMGGVTRRVEDASTSLPVIGDKIREAQQRGVETFNRAAINRVLGPIGGKLPEGVQVGRDAINYADDAVSAAYQRVLPRMVGATDRDFSIDVMRIWNDALGGALPAEKAEQFGRILKNQIFDKMGPNGVIQGDRLKSIESQLGTFARNFSTSANADDKILGSYVSELQSAFRDMLARVNPPDLSRGLQDANRAFANLVRAERAAASGGAVEGVFTPAQLSQAVRMSDSSSRRAATARGDALMQDLSDAGKAVLPATMGDSGTFTRGALNAGTLAALGTGAMTGAIPLAPIAGGAAVYGAYTQPAQRLLQALLAGERPQALQRLGGAISQGGGAVTVPLAAALASGP
ncbi:MAG: hypothetical protein INF12_14585 [Methylobacterium sp.]|nr:hypothetical protein [Methylobacterium sp.]